MQILLNASLDFAVEVLAEEVRVGHNDEGHGQDWLLLVLHDDPEALKVEDGGRHGRHLDVNRVEGGDEQVDQEDIGHCEGWKEGRKGLDRIGYDTVNTAYCTSAQLWASKFKYSDDGVRTDGVCE